MGYIEIHLDEPLWQKLNHGACETISRIHMADFQVENTLGLTVIPTNREYWGVPQVKDRLNLEDFIGNALGEGADGNRIPGTNHDCVEEFAVIFQQQYDNMLAAGMLGEDIKNLEDYLDQFASMGEYDHKEDQPFYKALLSDVLDLTIIKPLIESCCGYDLITGEDLTEMERNMKVIGALVDLVTLATGIYGFTTAAKSMGWKKAASYFGQLALVELASDVSATTVATIGDYCDWPMGVTMLLSLGTGLTVGQVGNHLIFKRNGIEIFRKEVSESGEFLEDLMSPEDAARFRKFLEEGSTAGLTPEELAGIGKVDDYLALNRVDYDDVLALRRSAAENGSDVFEEIHWEDLMSPEDAARFRKFLEEGSTAGLTPEELAGIGRVDDYLALNRVDYDDVLTLRKEAIEGGTATDLTIMSRNSGRGNPSAITHFDVDLNTRQNNLLQQLPNCDSSIIINKGDVNLKDLAALTAKTGDEFAMFTRGSQRMIIRGNANAVNINGSMAQELYNAGYKWSGHTHPGNGINVRFASEGDMFILEQFNQTQSVIYDSYGNFNVFEIGE